MDLGVYGSTVGGLLRLRATQLGDAVFARSASESRTYAELDARADRVAAGLHELGLEPGDAVALMLPNELRYLDAWFGTARGGLVHVPINTAYKGDHLRWALELSSARVLVVDERFLPLVEELSDDLPDLDHLVVTSSAVAAPDLPIASSRWEDFLDRAPDPATVVLPDLTEADTASLMFTSGTTGRSKGVVAPHGHHLMMGATTADVLRLTSQDVLFTVLPLFHGNAQLTTVIAGMVAGASVHIADRFSARTFWHEIRSSGATAFNLLSTMANVLLSAPPSERDRDHSVRVMMGAPVPADTLYRFERRFGGHIIEAYGTTEIGMIAANPHDARRPGSFGRPTGGEIELLGPEGHPVGPGEIGELCYRPAQANIMCAGYHRNPEATAEALRGAWWHTGDLARRDADGYLYFVDREKDAIRHKGENVSSFEVEQAILALAGVEHAAVLAVPSSLSEDDILAVVAPADGRPIDPAAIFEQCDRRLPHFMVPRYVLVTSDVPLTQTGRVNKPALRTDDVAAQAWDAHEHGLRPTRYDRTPRSEPDAIGAGAPAS